MSPASPDRKNAAKAKLQKEARATLAPAPRTTGAAPVAGPARGSVVSPETAAVDMARDLAAIVEERSLSELVLETPTLTLTLRRGGPAVGQQVVHQVHATPMPAPTAHGATHPPVAPPAAAPVVDEKHHLVTSPFVGTYYSAPGPDAQAYVVEGQKVEKGQTLCIVEAMKLMNEIEADVAGTVVKAMVENGKTVEYGQVLFKIARS